MTIDSIKNGVVIDHIKAGKSMELYRFLNLESLDSQVAIIKNAPSKKMGRKDITKYLSDLLEKILMQILIFLNLPLFAYHHLYSF